MKIRLHVAAALLTLAAPLAAAPRWETHVVHDAAFQIEIPRGWHVDHGTEYKDGLEILKLEAASPGETLFIGVYFCGGMGLQP